MALTQFVEVLQCSDKMMWYHDCVGQYFTFKRKLPEGYLVVDKHGYSNIILKKDGRMITRYEEQPLA